MPPKTKKELEEEARRLEEERKKKQEQQAALEAQRKKYASEKLDSTGLILPVTQLFLEEFSIKPLSFAQQILRRFLDTAYPSLLTVGPQKYNIFLKQFYNNIRFCLQNYIWERKSQKDEDPSAKYMASRVAIGILFAVFMEEYELYGNGKKSKESDYTLFSKLVIQHTKEQFLTKERAAELIKYARTGYFAHHNLMFKWMNFEKRQQVSHSYIYVDTPAKLFNTKETLWTDLSKKEESTKLETVVAPHITPS